MISSGLKQVVRSPVLLLNSSTIFSSLREEGDREEREGDRGREREREGREREGEGRERGGRGREREGERGEMLKGRGVIVCRFTNLFWVSPLRVPNCFLQL